MTTEENEAIVHRFVEEVMNRGNLDAAEDLIAPDHVNHDPTAPEVPPGPEGIKQLIAGCTAQPSPTSASRRGR
jgi:predicted SnoaL-like aldol condensation-catalyzing enzyme